MKIKNLFLLAGCLTCQAALFAQAPSTSFNLKQILPTSPEAAALGKFGEIPVGSYTGTADVSIPLYSISEAGVTIPVTLSYHTSGVKVEDDATNVGLGWSLEPGGAIIQIVNGKPDPDPLGLVDLSDYAYTMSQGAQSFFFARYPIGSYGFNCRTHGGEAGDSQTMLTSMSQGYFQPDIYQYSFGGFSGKFYINPQTSQPVMLDKKANITFTWSLTSITATTMDGNKFIFDVLETSHGTLLTEYTGQTYKLSKIILHTGKTITFTYQNGYYQGRVYNETFHTDLPANKDDGHQNTTDRHPDYSMHFIKMLKSITTDKVIVNFNLDDRADLYSSDPNNKVKRIASVDIVDSLSNQKIKSYNFAYDYFTSTNTIGSNSYTGSVSGMPTGYVDALTKRLKLLSVTEVGYTPSQTAVLSVPYTFTYNQGVSLPDKANYARDYWGFYNGKDFNTKLLPDLSFFTFSDDNDYKFVRPALFSNVAGANRAPDSSKMKAWTLSRITYPTGGYSEFDYQPHIFTNHIYPDVERASAATKTLYDQDYNQPTDQKSVTFTLQKTETITFYAEISRQQNTSYAFSQLQPSTITLTKTLGGITTTIKTWQMFTSDESVFGTQGFISWVTPISIPYQAGAQYTLTTYLPDGLGPQSTFGQSAEVDAHFTYYDPGTTFTNSYGGGLRISAVRNYDMNGSLATRKTYKYVKTDGTPSGIMMSPYKPLVSRVVFGTQHNDGGANPYIMNASDTVWYVSSESAVPYSDAAGGNIVGYSRIEETETATDGSINGKHVSIYNNQPSNSYPDVPDDPNLLNGMMSREENYVNSATTPLSATDYNYTELVPGSYFAGLKVMSVYAGDDISDCTGWAPNPGIWPNVQKWLIYYYPLHSQWYVLSSKTTTENFNGQALTTTHSYGYNAIGQMSSDAMTNSKGQALTTNYTYPYDIPAGSRSTAQQALVDKSLYNSLIQQTNFNNTTVTSEDYITYNFTPNNQLARSKIEHEVGQQGLYTEYTFDDYGPYKTLNQASEKGVKPSALLWNDNKAYIIADAVNAKSPDAAYTSFEPNQAGKWTIPVTTRNSGGITGIKCYPLGSGAISDAGLTAATTYVVSYWTQSLTANTVNGTITGYPIKGQTINGWTYYEHHVTGVTTATVSGSGNIDEVRLYPLGAQMTSYTYDQVQGITSTIDAKNQVSYYEYDSLRRLMNIKDKDGNIIKHMDYHYQGQ